MDTGAYLGGSIYHLGGHIFSVLLGLNVSYNIHWYKFCTEMENRQPKEFQFSEIRFSKIQDGGRPPSWISIFGHNFGVDQHFFTKFCTEMENRQPKWIQCSEIRFSEIQYGGRPQSWISISAHNSASSNIFAPNLAQWWKSTTQGDFVQNQVMKNPR